MSVVVFVNASLSQAGCWGYDGGWYYGSASISSALLDSPPCVGLRSTNQGIAEPCAPTDRKDRVLWGLGKGATNVVERSQENFTAILGGRIDFYWVEKRAWVGERILSTQKNAREWRF